VRFLNKRWLVGALLASGAMLGARQLLADPAARLALRQNEILQRTDQLDAQVRDDLQHVLHLQELSRKEKDAIKLTCVNDKLVAIKAEANIFDNSRHELQSLTGMDGFAQTYGSVVQNAETVHQIRGEADQCVGEPELAGESSNGFEHPPFPDNPTIGDPFGGTVEPPIYASPFN